jgi:hypothetical protein
VICAMGAKRLSSVAPGWTRLGAGRSVASASERRAVLASDGLAKVVVSPDPTVIDTKQDVSNSKVG